MNIKSVLGFACRHGMLKAIAIGAITLSLTACGSGKWGFPYRIDVQQGNWITASQVEQLEVGMTREQVRFVLGTPTLQDIFYSDRWEYPYYFKPGYGEEELRTFTVWFEGDQLVRWDGSEQPDRQPFERADSGAQPRNLGPRDEPSGIPIGDDEIMQSPDTGATAEPMPVPGPGAPAPSAPMPGASPLP